MFKSRSVPACACCSHTTERFVCTCCEFFLTLPLKNSGMIYFNLGVSLHVLAVYTPQNVFLHMLRVLFNDYAKKLVIDLFKFTGVSTFSCF